MTAVVERLSQSSLTREGRAVRTLVAIGLAYPPEFLSSISAAGRAAMIDAAWALARIVRPDGGVPVATVDAVAAAVRRARSEVLRHDRFAWPGIPPGDDLTAPMLWGARWLRHWMAGRDDLPPIVRSHVDAAARRLVWAVEDLERACFSDRYPVRKVRELDRRVEGIADQLPRIGPPSMILDRALCPDGARAEPPPAVLRSVAHLAP